MKYLKRFSLLLAVVMMASSTVFALNPSRTYKQKPDKFNMEYEEHVTETNDGSAKLKIWDFPPKQNTTQLILICHNGEGNMADYLRRVDQFTSIGYRVVIFDYRGFGESSDFEIDNNMYIYPHFTDDVETMIDWCRKTHVSTFHIYGWGIGAGLSLGIGWGRPEVKKIIADTPFFSMEDLEERFSDWDEPMEVPFAGYDKKFEPLYTLDGPPQKNIQGVKLIIGSNDELMNEDDMKTLQGKQKKLIDKDIYVVDNPDNKDNFRVDKAAYFEKIRAFLQD